MQLSISQATTMSGSFAEDIQAYSEAGWLHAEVWLTKLEKHLQTTSVADTHTLLESKQMVCVAASYQGGLLLSQGEARKAAFDLYKSRLSLCQEFKIPLVILVADFIAKVDVTTLERAIVSLKQVAQWASAFEIRVALEFRGGDTFCSGLDTAHMLIDQAGEPNLGICLDVFHYYRGNSKLEDLRRLPMQQLFHAQLCDVAGLPRELMSDSDRIMPGEGDFALLEILQLLQERGYTGAYSLELMNPVLWGIKSSQVAELGLTAMKNITAIPTI